MRLWNLAPIVYTVDSPVPSSAMPQRLLRNDAADRLIRGAIAVGRCEQGGVDDSSATAARGPR